MKSYILRKPSIWTGFATCDADGSFDLGLSLVIPGHIDGQFRSMLAICPEWGERTLVHIIGVPGA